MPRILIAGCGYVGEAAATLFANSHWKVTGWTRSTESTKRLSAGAIDARAVDIRDFESVRAHSFGAEVVVHCASSQGGRTEAYRSIYRDGVAHLVRCFPQARLIFTSSTSVYVQRDGSWVTEESAAEPSTETGRLLREAEEIVLRNGGIVLRVGAIYGPGRSFLLRSVLQKKAITDDRFVNQAHRDDIVSAIFFLAQRAHVAPPRLFNVVDNTPAPRAEILHWLSRRMAIPLSVSDVAERSRRRGDTNKRVSNAKLRKLGWVPVYRGYVDGFERSVLPGCEQL